MSPYLGYPFYALFVGAFPHDILYVRLIALCLILASTLCIYVMLKIAWNRKVAGIASIIFIYFMSISPSGQALMTEIIAVLPLLAALYVSQSNDLNGWRCASIGLLLSLAVFARMNLAICVVFFTPYVMFVVFQRDASFNSKILKLCAYVGGGMLPVITILALYFMTGHFDRLLASLEIAWRYSQEQLPVLDVILKIIFQDLRIYIFLWIGVFFACKYAIGNLQKLSDSQLHMIAASLVMMTGIVASIIMGGAYYGHYMIQVVPFAAMLSSLAFYWLVQRKLHLGFIIIIVFVFTFTPILKAYEHMPYQRDVGYEVADYLEQHVDNESVYLMRWHIAYWLADIEPISRIHIHPSSVSRTFMTEHDDQLFGSRHYDLASILDSRPDYIIKPEDVFYLETMKGFSQALDQFLANEYELEHTIGPAYIYRLKQSSNRVGSS